MKNINCIFIFFNTWYFNNCWLYTWWISVSLCLSDTKLKRSMLKINFNNNAWRELYLVKIIFPKAYFLITLICTLEINLSNGITIHIQYQFYKCWNIGCVLLAFYSQIHFLLWPLPKWADFNVLHKSYPRDVLWINQFAWVTACGGFFSIFCINVYLMKMVYLELSSACQWS